VAAGAAVGILISIVLIEVGWMPLSFADGGPAMEIDKTRAAKKNEEPEFRDYSAAEVRAEIRKEMLFLMPPMFLGGLWMVLTWKVPAISAMWNHVVAIDWVSGLLGSVLGLLVGGFVVWLVRFIGSYVVGREAMGLGDVHLMAAVGAVLGPGPATVAFFIAPFFGILHAMYLFFARKGHELWLGPYLSLATAAVMLFYCEIANYLAPGLTGLMLLIVAGMKRLGF
jgi:leader peptidase (prepilin peptidase)/N-methyltransferase